MELKQAQEHIAIMKQEQPEEYAKLLNNYKSEQDLLWELRHFTQKTMKALKRRIPE